MSMPVRASMLGPAPIPAARINASMLAPMQSPRRHTGDDELDQRLEDLMASGLPLQEAATKLVEEIDGADAVRGRSGDDKLRDPAGPELAEAAALLGDAPGPQGPPPVKPNPPRRGASSDPVAPDVPIWRNGATLDEPLFTADEVAKFRKIYRDPTELRDLLLDVGDERREMADLPPLPIDDVRNLSADDLAALPLGFGAAAQSAPQAGPAVSGPGARTPTGGGGGWARPAGAPEVPARGVPSPLARPAHTIPTDQPGALMVPPMASRRQETATPPLAEGLRAAAQAAGDFATQSGGNLPHLQQGAPQRTSMIDPAMGASAGMRPRGPAGAAGPAASAGPRPDLPVAPTTEAGRMIAQPPPGAPAAAMRPQGQPPTSLMDPVEPQPQGDRRSQAPAWGEPSPATGIPWGETGDAQFMSIIRGAESRGAPISVVNKTGAGGRYQFLPERLESVGFVKPGSVAGLVKSGLTKQEARHRVWQDEQFWTLEGGPSAYLNSAEMQDRGQRLALKQDYARLRRAGLVGPDSAPEDVAGIMLGAHLGGAGGVIQHMRTGGQYNPSDPNGTRISDYIERGRQQWLSGAAVGGTATAAASDQPQERASMLNPAQPETAPRESMLGSPEREGIWSRISRSGLPETMQAVGLTMLGNAGPSTTPRGAFEGVGPAVQRAQVVSESRSQRADRRRAQQQQRDMVRDLVRGMPDGPRKRSIALLAATDPDKALAQLADPTFGQEKRETVTDLETGRPVFATASEIAANPERYGPIQAAAPATDRKELSKARVAHETFTAALDRYAQALREAGGGSLRRVAGGPEAVKLKGLHTAVIDGIRQMANAGVLNIGEIPIMEQRLLSPDDWDQAFLQLNPSVDSLDVMLDQVEDLRQQSRDRLSAFERTYSGSGSEGQRSAAGSGADLIYDPSAPDGYRRAS